MTIHWDFSLDKKSLSLEVGQAPKGATFGVGLCGVGVKENMQFSGRVVKSLSSIVRSRTTILQDIAANTSKGLPPTLACVICIIKWEHNIRMLLMLEELVSVYDHERN